MNKGLNYSPTLPQHESGDSQGYTRSVLSEGNITIGGKKTSARALGIHTDSATAHHGADSVPDLQNLLDKQQTIAQSTAAIHSAVGTYRGNRAKAAAEELEKQQAAYEGRLKEQNDGSYEQYAGKSDSERLAMRLGNAKYAQAYQEARSWGVGGSKSRALSAAETLITGALGGQGDLQLAANTLAPYAAAAIGKRFGHGEHKNEAAQAIGHFMLGAALAYANGADPLTGGSAAVAAERAAEYLAKQYDDGKTAIDPITGKFNPNLLPEHIKEEIKAQTGALASVVGAAGGSLNGTNGANNGNGNALFNAQVGGVLGQNAVENNALNRLDGFTPGERSLRARADKIYQNNPKGKDLYIRSYEAYELEASYLAAKEIVVGTWEGIRHPWDNTIVPLAEAVSSPVQTVNKVVMSYKNWKAVRDEAYINDPQLAGRMDAMFDARVGANAAFMVVSGGTASAIVRSRAAAKVVNSAGNLSKKGLTLSSPPKGGTAREKFDKAVGNVAEKVGQGNAVYDQTFGKRDRLGRLHDQKTGRYLTDPNRLDTDLVRSSLRAETKRLIESEYTRLPNGSYRHKVTRQIVQPPVHYGHIKGWENRRILKAADELGMTQQQLNDYVNARPSIFKLENAKDNLSHRYEKPGIDDLEDIRDDMEKFLTTGK